MGIEKARANEARRQPTGRMVPCPGQAHDPEVGGMIDHCGRCAPRWGQVPELAPVDLDAARAAGLDVPWGELDDAQTDRALALEAAGAARSVMVERKGRGCTTSYVVLRWVRPDELPLGVDSPDDLSQPFCACGRTRSRCDRSRAGCLR